LVRRGDDLRDIGLEALQLAVGTGPVRASRRGLSAAGAVALTARSLAEARQSGTPVRPEAVLRELFEKLGTTYIKLGQFVASSPTLFPEEYVEEFQACLDRTEPVPFETIRRTIRDGLGRPIEEVFEYVDPRPLASASIAQVHAAVLRGSGKDVVVKVLKPGVEDTLTVDLNAIYVASRLLEFLSPDLSRASLAAVVGDLRASMFEEVDFTKEVRNMKEFGAFLDQSGLRGVATVPFVYEQASSRRVLTMERLFGVPLSDLEGIRRVTRKEPEMVLIAALNTWLASLSSCGTFHADLHAGNMLVLRDGKVGFIDFGIVGRLSPGTWQAMQALLLGAAARNYDAIARALVTIGATGEDVDIDAFAGDLAQLFSAIDQLDARLVATQAGGASAVEAAVVVDEAQVNRLVLDIVRVSETHGLRFPREFGLLLKQMLYFDRYVQVLAPELQMLSDARVLFN